MKITKTLFVVGALLAFASTANAQEISKLDQILVTGSRTPLTVRQTGSAVSVFTRDQIERREARNVAELLRTVPGFSVSHSGVTGSQTQVRVRGAEANHVLVMIDGVRATDPATGDEFRWEYLSTANIERIEIVRGTQSALWGSDAVAAVVHIITRQGGATPNLSGYAESGSNSTANAALNGNVSAGGWSVNGGMERLNTDGSNVSRNGSEDDDSDLTTLSLNSKFQAGEQLELSFGVRTVDAYSQFDPVDFIVTGLPADGDVATDARNTYAHIGAALDTNGRVLHRIALHYFDSDNDNLIDGSWDSTTASERLTAAYQADIRFGRNQLSLAIEHEDTDFEQRGQIVFGDPNQTQSMQASSVVAEFQALTSERLSWIVSARLDDNSDFDDALNGRLSVAYQLSDATNLRGSIGTGQKNPTFTERYGYFPMQFVGNSELQPEQSTNYEIGVDQFALQGKLLAQVTLFKHELKDEINGFVFDPVTFLSTAENIAEKSQRSGAELSANFTVTDSFVIGAHYTYLDSKQSIVRRPRHSGGLSLDYMAAERGLGMVLNADYGGERTDLFFAPFPDPVETVTLDSHWLIDLTVNYQLSSTVSLFAKGTNLLDEQYEHVFGYRTLGRAGFFGARMNFGQ